ILALIAAATLALALTPNIRAAGAADAYASVREEFQQAYARASKDDTGADDSERLKSYPLYPYLQAERLGKALAADASPGDDVDKRAAAFVAANERIPVVRRVRRAWLESFARRERWAAFLDLYKRVSPDAALRCQSFVARIALNRTRGLVRDIADQWLTPHSLQECKVPFDWMKTQGVLTQTLIEQRARLALQSGDVQFARQMLALLSSDRAAPLAQWAALLEDPKKNIDALIASPDTSVDAEALLAGWSRLARVDSAAAKERYTPLVESRRLGVESASPFARTLALRLALERDSAALDYFPGVAEPDRDEQALEWWARAALWAGDWKQAAQIIGRLPQSRRESARWRYWAARAAEKLHDADEARRLYESVLADDNYYSAMAAGRLMRDIVPHAEALPSMPELQAALELRPAVARARELFLCGMRQDAAAEWQLAYQSLSEAERRQSIHLAASWGWYDQAVATATAQGVFNDYDLLYPTPFDEEVVKAAQMASMSPQLVYGVIRQESLYRPDAVSSAGARGLMQLRLETARRTAREFKLPKPSADDLFQPAVNATLGAAHLRSLLDRFGNQLPVALAAYNAGPNAAARWLPTQPIDADVWIENIPYAETREYVQRILWHRLMFTWLRENDRPQQKGLQLAPITAMGEGSTEEGVAGTG
ncbi:MAG TPA: transglycosylase SLT domain-containing protein, partial [Steroidobacteraceae bacterium]|nr:transglycosylase SLT domain-containing protein [Steroidobacteraceae bacterium]